MTLDWRSMAQEAYEDLFADDAVVLEPVLVLRRGWEMDNFAWIVRLADGTVALRTTSHGAAREMAGKEAIAFLSERQREHQEAVRSMSDARSLLSP